MNVQNLDLTDPRPKFARLAAIVVEDLRSPDLLVIEELQDDDGPRRSAVVTAAATARTLIAAIAGAGGPPYTFRSIDPVDGQDGGEPGGNIRVGFLVRGDRGLALVERGQAASLTANVVVDTGGVPSLAYSPGRIDPTTAAFAGSRKPLAAEFTFRGGRLFVVACHFASKSGDQPAFGRFQPPSSLSSGQRLAQAHLVSAFARRLLSVDPSANLVVLGDLNDFEFSAAIATLEAAGLHSLIATLPPAERYTYVFQGFSQALDHILVSPNLAARLTGFDVVHVNAEYATQASDHDPSLASFSLAER
jgi:predicted extracellular nuclease